MVISSDGEAVVGRSARGPQSSEGSDRIHLAPDDPEPRQRGSTDADSDDSLEDSVDDRVYDNLPAITKDDKRSCTDPACLVLFVLMMCYWIGITVYGIINGDLPRLVHPKVQYAFAMSYKSAH